jgi:hypothetical protein
MTEDKIPVCNSWKEYLEFEIKNLQEELEKENIKIAMENKK